MKSYFLFFILLFASTLLHIASTLQSTIQKRNSRSSNPQGKNVGKEYSDYTDYSSKSESSRRVWDNSQAGSTDSLSQSLPHPKNNEHSKLPPKNVISKLKLVPNWPDPNNHLGQISAVDIDTEGNVIIFHRGDHIWGSQTFTFNNIYTEKELGPIQQNTVIEFDASSGLVLREWGSNMFFIPHGLSVDFQNNIWITDVALHQVFKFPGNKSSDTKPLMTLGIPFTPGNDDIHFCKPTAVAVMKNGDFFVSDGYCNSRIIKFDSAGKKLLEWGRSTLSGSSGKPPPDHFQVPHALAIAEEKEMLFVADRENGRVQCFNTSSGVYIRQLHSLIMGPRIFSVAYAPVHGGLLYVVNGPSFGDTSVKVGGFVVSLISDEFVAHFNSNGDGFQNPHDVAVTKDGSQVYVVELNPFKVWKFVSGNLNFSVPITQVRTVSSVGNISTASQTLSGEKMTSSPVTGITAIKITSPSKGSVAALAAAIASVLIVIFIAVTVIILRIRRGCLTRYYSRHPSRWDFRIPSAEGFKLGQFLDRHQGFEKVSTEESDEEGNAGGSEMQKCAQFA